MPKQIDIVYPNLAELGLEMQQKIIEGYRLDEGFPFQNGWTFIARMTKAETVADAVNMASKAAVLTPAQEELTKPEPEQKRPGRPAKAK